MPTVKVKGSNLHLGSNVGMIGSGSQHLATVRVMGLQGEREGERGGERERERERERET